LRRTEDAGRYRKAAEIWNLSHEERTQLFPEPPEIEGRGHVGRSISCTFFTGSL